jgi:hypothetical protein
MKTKVPVMAGLFLLLCLTVASCKKVTQAPESKNPEATTEIPNVVAGGAVPNVTVVNGRLKFNSITEYKLLYDDAGDAVNYTALNQVITVAKSSSNYINLMDFADDTLGTYNSYSTNLAFTQSLIDSVASGFVLQIFNPDGIVQVGNKILKLSLNSKDCYSLDAANEAAGMASLKTANPSHPTITKLTGEQALLDNLGATWKCDGDDADEGVNHLAYNYYSSRYRQECWVEYKRWALHKLLQSRSKSQRKMTVGGWWNYRADHTIKTNLEKWQTRCGKEIINANPYTTFTGNRWYADKLYFEKFTGAKLSRYHIKAQFKLFDGSYSPELEIKYGY